MSVVLQTKQLVKTYDKKVKAVQGINLELYKGEVLGLLGPNGAGKTTYIKMLVGILKPNSGEILINGKKLNGKLSELKGLIGYTPQELVFYPFLNCLENMRLFASLYNVPKAEERIYGLMELFQLLDLSDRRAENMSGGQKRRLNIALSLLHSPKILFLDEPSAGMDPQSRNVLWESIDNLVQNEGVTIILTTHLMEVADRLSDRIAIIDHGKVLTIGTPDELKNRYKTGETIELQFSKNIEKKHEDKLLAKLRVKYPKLTTENERHYIKTSSGVSDITKVMGILEKSNAVTYLQDIQLRLGTLEDVFLHLTGKQLREGDDHSEDTRSEKNEN